MKNKCDIVQDLLPLYVDGCCTQSSRELVEEHLQECAACKQVFGEMTGDIPTPEEPQPEAEPVPAEPVPEEPEKKQEYAKTCADCVHCFIDPSGRRRGLLDVSDKQRRCTKCCD